LGGEAGGGDLVVAECGGDDRGGQVEDVLADRSGAGSDGRDAEGLHQVREGAGLQRLAGARRPGNNQRDSRLVAVRMLVRWLTYSSSRSATGSGIGDGGSPRRSRAWPPSRMMSSMVSRVIRLTGWA